MKKSLIVLLVAMLCTVAGFSQRINPTSQIKKAPAGGYILESESDGDLVFIPGTSVFQTSADPVGAPPAGKANLHVNVVTGVVRAWNGTAWVIVGGNGVTNLTYTNGASTGTVNSSTGTGATIPAATTSIAGLMTATDKTNQNALVTLTGVPAGSLNLGAFSGTTIPANSTIKAALQSLITAQETGDSVRNGITGNGRPASPHKLGGSLTENTTIEGQDFNISINNAGTLVLESDATSRTHRTELVLTGTNTIGSYLRHINKSNINNVSTLMLDLDNTMGLTYQAEAGEPMGYLIIPNTTTATSDLSIRTKNVASGTATPGQVLTLGVGGVAEYQTPTGGVSEYNVTVTGANSGSNLRVKGPTGTTATWTSGTNTLNVNLVSGTASVDWRLVSADVQATADGGGATNWVLVKFNSTGGNTGIDNLRIPLVQKTAIPTSGTLSVSNAATVDLDLNPAISVVEVASNSVTIRVSGLLIGNQGYHLKFVEP
jgi:hypothetical protein